MKTLAANTLPLPPVPVANDPLAGSGGGGGVAGAGSPFAALLQGRDGTGAATADTAQTRPSSSSPAASGPASQALPVLAASGKNVPHPAEEPAGDAAAAKMVAASGRAGTSPPAIPAALALAAGELADSVPAPQDKPEDGAGDTAPTDPATIVPALAQPYPAIPAPPALALVVGADRSRAALAARSQPDTAAGNAARLTAGSAPSTALTASAPATSQVAVAIAAAPPGAVAPVQAMSANTQVTAAVDAAAKGTDALATSENGEGTPTDRGAADARFGRRADTEFAARAAQSGDLRDGRSGSAGAEAESRRDTLAGTVSHSARQDGFSLVSATPLAGSDKTAVAPSAAFARQAPDRAEVVANVVDRLMAAREAGVSTLASVAIGHRDFGDLTVRFADRGGRLDVAVSAADPEAQRALAASLHAADRPVARETAPSSGSPPGHAAAMMPQERGADGQLARHGGGHQPRGEAAGEHRRHAEPAAPPAEREAPAAGRGGIYV